MKDKTDQELVKLLTEARATLRKERFTAAGGRPKDPSAAKKLRKEIARILTEGRARALRT